MFLSALMYRTTALPLNGHLLASLFYLHNLVYSSPSAVLGVAWSLEIEVQFYLLVPLLTPVFAIRDHFLRRSMLCASIVGCLVLQALFLHGNARATLSIAAYLQFFLLGFLLADFFLIEWRVATKPALAWDIAALLGWPLLFYTLRFPGVAHWAFPALLFLLYCAAFRGFVSNRIVSRPWITAIGGMCYSIYLIHYEVISAIGRFTKSLGRSLPGPAYLLLQFIIVGFAIVVVCGAYFVVLEKPCMRRDWPRRAKLWVTERRFSRSRKASVPAEA
jgi:peptidoglycan/LPS O-acetylase OafA/YrhL